MIKIESLIESFKKILKIDSESRDEKIILDKVVKKYLRMIREGGANEISIREDIKFLDRAVHTRIEYLRCRNEDNDRLVSPPAELMIGSDVLFSLSKHRDSILVFKHVNLDTAHETGDLRGHELLGIIGINEYIEMFSQTVINMLSKRKDCQLKYFKHSVINKLTETIKKTLLESKFFDEETLKLIKEESES